MSLFRCGGSPVRLGTIYSVNDSISADSSGLYVDFLGIKSLSLQIIAGYGATIQVYNSSGNLIHTENMQDYNLHVFSITSSSGKIRFVGASSSSKSNITIKSIL